MKKSALAAAALLLIGASASRAGPLHDAVRDGDLLQLEALIEDGADFAGTSVKFSAIN